MMDEAEMESRASSREIALVWWKGVGGWWLVVVGEGDEWWGLEGKSDGGRRGDDISVIWDV